MHAWSLTELARSGALSVPFAAQWLAASISTTTVSAEASASDPAGACGHSDKTAAGSLRIGALLPLAGRHRRHHDEGMTATTDPASASAPPTRHIGILLFQDVEELDAVGPWEVLAYWTRHHPEDGFAVSCLSHDGAPVTAAKGMVLGAHAAVDQAAPLEVLIHPGGQGTRPLLRHPAHLEWVRAQRAQCH